MRQKLQVKLLPGESTSQAMARNVISPECLSASVLTICQSIDRSQFTETGRISQATEAVDGSYYKPIRPLFDLCYLAHSSKSADKRAQDCATSA